jgi:CubicO group peptidase (beta-lactamase class C family)
LRLRVPDVSARPGIAVGLAVIVGLTGAASVPAADSDIAVLVRERLAAGFGTTMVVGLVDHGVRTFASEGMGVNGPAGPDTAFEIASITKVLTTSLLAVLAATGDVTFDTPAVSLYATVAPRLPERDGRPVTLAELASHTAGLPKMPDDLRSTDPRDPERGYTSEMLYAFLDRYRAPGFGYEYSNIGIALLGEALGQSSNTTYAAVLRDRLLAPLGMTSTWLPGETSDAPVTGYDDAMMVVPPFSSGVFDPAGGMVSTAADLLSFADAYLGRGQADVVAALHNAATFSVSDPVSGRLLGLGWDLMKHEGRMLLTKDGSAAGYSAFIVIDIGNDRAVVVLSNGQGAVNDLALHMLDPRIPVRSLGPVIAIEPEQLEPLVGTYEGDGTGPVVFTRVADGLYLQFGDLPAPIRLFPESTTRFVAHAFDGVVKFHEPASASGPDVTAVIDGMESALDRR